MEAEIYGDQPEIKKNHAILQKITNWSCEKLKLPAAYLAIIFTDDEQLRQMHDQYLNDNTYTDVMTFNLGDEASIEGEIYISLDRARAQSEAYHVNLMEEVSRLIIHGVLHLAGWDDLDPADRRKMKTREDGLVAEAREVFGIEMRD